MPVAQRNAQSISGGMGTKNLENELANPRENEGTERDIEGH